MKQLRVNIKGVVESRSDVGSLLREPGDAVIIQRGQPRWMLLRCPCRCGEDIPINLDRRSGKAWRYYPGSDEQVTLFPSVWRDTGCQSHFIVWRGRILLLDYDEDESEPLPGLADLVEQVRLRWPRSTLTSYVDIAEQWGEIPWDVLEACRRLVREGILVEGSGRERSMFRRR